MKYKKKKKVMSITEQVGDTSGFNEENVQLDKKRKLTLYAGLLGIGVLILVAILFFATPTKVYFNSGTVANTISFTVSKETGLLEDAPTDDEMQDNQVYFEFYGWYTNASMKGEPLYNNDSDDSLLTYKFSKFSNTTLYAKWEAKKYYISYVYADETQFEGKSQSVINNINSALKSYYEGHSQLSDGLNPTYVTIKHELSAYEEETYFNLASDILSSVYKNLSYKEFSTKIMDTVNKYKELCKYSSKTLTNIDTSKFDALKYYNFLGWYDKDGNKVESISLNDPKTLTLYAHYEKK